MVRRADSEFALSGDAGGRVLPYVGDVDHVLDELEEFLTGARHPGTADRVLATVLFVDISGSTPLAQTLGDRRWHDLLEDYRRAVRRLLERFRGQEIDTAGDGFLATFDGPARAVRCAHSIRDACVTLGLDIHAGVHTGEVELRGEPFRAWRCASVLGWAPWRRPARSS